jgi:hypothetical protein
MTTDYDAVPDDSDAIDEPPDPSTVGELARLVFELEQIRATGAWPRGARRRHWDRWVKARSEAPGIRAFCDAIEAAVGRPLNPATLDAARGRLATHTGRPLREVDCLSLAEAAGLLRGSIAPAVSRDPAGRASMPDEPSPWEGYDGRNPDEVEDEERTNELLRSLPPLPPGEAVRLFWEYVAELVDALGAWSADPHTPALPFVQGASLQAERALMQIDRHAIPGVEHNRIGMALPLFHGLMSRCRPFTTRDGPPPVPPPPGDKDLAALQALLARRGSGEPKRPPPDLDGVSLAAVCAALGYSTHYAPKARKDHEAGLIRLEEVPSPTGGRSKWKLWVLKPSTYSRLSIPGRTDKVG